MPVAARLRSFLRTLFAGSSLDSDLAAEIDSAVEELAARKTRAGVPPDEARRLARLEVGGVEQVREDVRRARTGAGLESWARDLRLAARSLGRSRGLTAAVVATFALGIGANTCIFSAINAVLLEPLPYRDPSRLAFVWADLANSGYPRAPLAGPEFKDLRERARTIAAVGGIWASTAALTGDGDPEQLRVGLVTANFFQVLGAEPAVGRTFAGEDESANAPAVILLSHELWQRRYGGDAGIVGRRILVNGAPSTVLGIMPPEFRLWMPRDANVPDDLQAWCLLPRNFTEWARGQQFLRVVARLRPGVSLAEADREVAAIGRKIGQEYADYGGAAPTFYAVSLQADGVREIRPPLLALFGGVTLLLAIACVNVANLLAARTASRRREIAMRVALGASRGRLVRQIALEGLLLALAGAVAGTAAAAAGLRALIAFRPDALNRIAGASLDTRVLAFTAGTALAWGFLCSLAPLRELFRTDVSGALRANARSSGSRRDYSTRAALVLLQVGLGIVLLVGAALMVRTFRNIERVDVGFAADHTLTLRVAPPGNRYRAPQAFVAFLEQLREKIRALPGVTAVSAVGHLPYDNLPNWSTPYLKEGVTNQALAREADARAVLPGYFAAVRAQIVDGRDFTPDDQAGKPFVAIVDSRLAARTWPGESAVGKRLVTDPLSSGTPTTAVTVVGVVKHLRHRSLTQEVREQIYYPEYQVLRSPLAFVIRTTGDPSALAHPVRRVVARLDPMLPVYDVRPLDDYVHRARSVPRFTMLLAASFGSAALALACVGAYGVLSYAVTRRRHELGIRLALGASRRSVLALVLREAAHLAAVGAAVGVAGGFVFARLMQSQLYGVDTSDPVAFGAAVLAVGIVVLAASLLPALRAARVNPLESLRAE